MSIAEAWPAAGRPFADECYRQVAQASGDQPYLAERPFPVEVIPSALVAGLRE
jgi:hypothetical protein